MGSVQLFAILPFRPPVLLRRPSVYPLELLKWLASIRAARAQRLSYQVSETQAERAGMLAWLQILKTDTHVLVKKGASKVAVYG
jgi:hypothetical protein